MLETSHTWQEITSQPEVWQATLEHFHGQQEALQGFLGRANFDNILVVGCGSTHYLAQAAATGITHRARVPARACPSSELWLFPEAVANDRTLLVAVSRSGATTETLYAADRFREREAKPVLAITCYPESPLAQRADLTLVAPDGQEQSIAQTRSFTSMLLLTQALSATLSEDESMLRRLRQLGKKLEELVDRVGELPQELGKDAGIDCFFFLGGGPLYGIANEAMLKTKEMSLTYSEAYHTLEFRHGPMSMVNEQTLVVGLLSDAGRAEEIKVLADMQELGARVLALVEDVSTLDGWQPDHSVELRSGLDEWERQPLYLPVLQRLAYHRAVAKGLDPDRPTNLEAVVKL